MIMVNDNLGDNYKLETLAVRGGIERSQFGEHSEAMYLTSSFVFKSAAQAAARFSYQEPGNVYSRFTNPTVTCSSNGSRHWKALRNVSPRRQAWRRFCPR